MRDAPTIIFFTITMIVAVVNVAFGISSFRKKKKIGNIMGLTCILAACATFSYLLSISNDVDLHNKYALLTSTFYFIFLELTLLSLLHSVLEYTGYANRKQMLYLFVPLFAFAIADSLILFISALQPAGHNFAVSVVSNSSFSSVPQYIMGVWFYFHLAFTYLLVALSLTALIVKATHVPYGYKKQFIIPGSDPGLIQHPVMPDLIRHPRPLRHPGLDPASPVIAGLTRNLNQMKRKTIIFAKSIKYNNVRFRRKKGSH